MKIPLLLISGLLSNQRLWAGQIQYLSQIASIRVISPAQNSPEKMVQAILKEAPPKFALAGHSMGGWLCLEVMRKDPSRVSQLCLLNTTVRRDSEEKKKKRQLMIQRVKSGEFQKVVKEIVDFFVFNALVKNDVEKMFLEVGPEAFIRQQESMLVRRECLSILPTIACPTLVVHAANDKNFSLEEHQEMAGKIKTASLAVVGDSGHMSPLEKPEEVNSLLESWLLKK